MDGKQGGDPAKLAAALVELAALEEPPVRFAAGADAAELSRPRPLPCSPWPTPTAHYPAASPTTTPEHLGHPASRPAGAWADQRPLMAALRAGAGMRRCRSQPSVIHYAKR
jgi:hypothetical protein